MDHKNLAVIEKLMEELQEQMQYGKDDLEERLGRKKPAVEVISIEGKLPRGSAMGEDESESTDPLEREDAEVDAMGDDEDMSPSMGRMAMDEADGMSPEESLKKRLMKLRG